MDKDVDQLCGFIKGSLTYFWIINETAAESEIADVSFFSSSMFIHKCISHLFSMLKYSSPENFDCVRSKKGTVLQKFPTGCNEVRYINATKMKNKTKQYAILLI